VTDNQMTGAIYDELAGQDLVPGRHYLDSGYLSAALVVSEVARHGIALIGPLLADTSAQACADFTVDYDAQILTCPQSRTSVSGRRAPSAARTRSWPPSPPPSAALRARPPSGVRALAGAPVRAAR
jgi:hypothetical protein